MISHAVIGLGFGDEGKGRVVDAIALKLLNDFHPSNLLNVRFNGGQQAGHTTFVNGKARIHSNFGSAIRREIPSYWGPRCTIHPVAIMNEYNSLVKEGYTPKLFIDRQCPITTPYEVESNRVDEENIKHGSCGMGFGKTIEREESMFSLTASLIPHLSMMRIKFQMLATYYRANPSINDSLIDRFWEAIDFINNCENIKIVDGFTNIGEIKGVIYEGAQGILLDKNIGFFPHVTRSNTNLTNVLELTKTSLTVNLVTRCYLTRHGSGPMPNEMAPRLVNREAEINEFNQYQGKFKIGSFDFNAFKYALDNVMPINSKMHEKSCVDQYNLHITCMDQIEDGIPVVDNGFVMSYDKGDFVRLLHNQAFPRSVVYFNPENF